MGIGKPARDFRVFRTSLDGVEVVENKKDDRIEKVFNTPVGTVSETFCRISGSQYGWVHLTHMIKGEEDYKVVEYIVEHTVYIPQYEDYIRYEKEIGEDGVPIVDTGYDPMFSILKDYIGYNNAYYEFADNKDRVEHLYEVLKNKLHQLQNILLESPARVILHGCHYDSMMTPPPIFNKYMKPYLQDFSHKLHDRGKILTVHADGDSKLLLTSFIESGIDMVECFCTYPMVSVTLREAFDVWGDKMIIWGGVPSTILCPSCYNYDEFLSYMNNVFKLIKEKRGRLILGAADNVMPEADIGRVEKISEMVEDFRY